MITQAPMTRQKALDLASTLLSALELEEDPPAIVYGAIAALFEQMDALEIEVRLLRERHRSLESRIAEQARLCDEINILLGEALQLIR